VYVNEEGGLLRSRGNRLRLERGQELVQSLAFPRVRQVVVFGRVGMTTPFLQQVLIRGIDLVLLSDTGRYYGRLQGATATNPFLRQRQYGAGQDPGRTLDLAKRFVDGKLVNLRSGLLRARRRGSVAGVDELIDRLERARTTLRDTPTLSAVLGAEGACPGGLRCPPSRADQHAATDRLRPVGRAARFLSADPRWSTYLPGRVRTANADSGHPPGRRSSGFLPGRLGLQARALADELLTGERHFEPLVWK